MLSTASLFPSFFLGDLNCPEPAIKTDVLHHTAKSIFLAAPAHSRSIHAIEHSFDLRIACRPVSPHILPVPCSSLAAGFFGVWKVEVLRLLVQAALADWTRPEMHGITLETLINSASYLEWLLLLVCSNSWFLRQWDCILKGWILQLQQVYAGSSFCRPLAPYFCMQTRPVLILTLSSIRRKWPGCRPCELPRWIHHQLGEQAPDAPVASQRSSCSGSIVLPWADSLVWATYWLGLWPASSLPGILDSSGLDVIACFLWSGHLAIHARSWSGF